ncbi:Ig-like domain repeat protein [Streptomyces sp. NPDC088725]|uniref:Ig-like domain repeat protein n=1 Tax=Streptomyces sp. NPDC088725 TaxID=3365873 RepID=UPI0037F399D7
MGTKRPTAALAAVLTAAIAAGTIAVAGPAMADPATGTFGTYVGVGSDTTQDVVNALAGTSLAKVASYNATGSGTIKTRAKGPEFTRPNGSGAGTKALSAALTGDKDPSKPADGAVMTGQVDFARSSGGPSTSGDTLVYIPFGRDAVGYVAKGDHLKNLTPEQLKDIYSSSDPKVGGKPVHPFIPQAGSGTRKFFLGAIGVADNASLPIASDHVVEENKANDVILQDGDLIPFSVASWVAQINNVAPDRSSKAAKAGAFVGALQLKSSAPAVSPVTADKAGKLSPVESYYNDATFGRDVYNVVPSRAIDESSAFFDKGLFDLFVSSGTHKPAIASDAAKNTIAQFGFLNESYNGSIDPGNHAKYGGLEGSTAAQDKPGAVRTFTGSVATPRQLKLTWTAPSATALPVTDYRVLVKNASGAVAYSKDVKAPATSLTVSLPAGKYTAQIFAANLVGAGAVKSLSATVTEAPVVKTASKTTATASPSKVAYGVSRKINVVTTGKSVPTGKVTIKEGKTSRGTGTLDKSGKVSVALSKGLSVGTHTLTVSYAGDSKLTASSATVKITVTKATPKLKQSAPSTVKPTAKAKVTATVTATGYVPTGKVQILEGKKVLATATLKNGKVTVTLPKLAKGKHSLKVRYVGTSTTNALTGKAFTITSK